MPSLRRLLRHRLTIALVAFVGVATTALLLRSSAPVPTVTKSGIPLPFGELDTSLAGKVVRFGTRNNITVDEVTFTNGETQESMQKDKIYLVHIPNEPSIARVPVDAILRAAGVDRSSVNVFCYRYADASALTEKTNIGATRFADRFPGKFCATRRARDLDTSNGGTIAAFEKQNTVTFLPTDGSEGSVMVEPNTLFVIVVNEPDGAVLRPVRTPASCGDGTIQSPETCDDGTRNGHVCSAAMGQSCTYCTATCTVATVAGSTSCAPSDCTSTPPYVPTQECSDGTKSGAVCAKVGQGCQWTTRSCTGCGNGVIDAPEECDDGNRIADDVCSNTCTINLPIPFGEGGSAACGNGQREGAEACDDGANNGHLCSAARGQSCTYCTATCTVATVSGDQSMCGNGAINEGETCDDGNSNTGEGCSAACAPEDGYTCSGAPSTCTPAQSTTYGLLVQLRAGSTMQAAPGATAVTLLRFDVVAGAENVRLESLIFRMVQGSLQDAVSYRLVEETPSGIATILTGTPSQDGSYLTLRDTTASERLLLPAKGIRRYAVVADIATNPSSARLELGLRTDAANVIFARKAQGNEALSGVRLDGSCLFGCDIDLITAQGPIIDIAQ